MVYNNAPVINHFYSNKIYRMKKQIAIILTATLFFVTQSFAQLGKIKKDRDEAAEIATTASADNLEGWNAVSNPQQVFDKYIFKVSDYSIEGITDKIQNAVEFNKIEVAFANSTWKFYNDGEVNVTNGNTVEYSFTVNGSTFIINDGKTKSQAQFTSKNSLYKLKLTEGNSKPIHLVLEPIAKKGYDLYSKKELRKYSLTYLATNGDMYMLKQPADYSNPYDSRYIYTNITPNGMFEQYIHYTDRDGGEGELYYNSVPINNINMNGFELVLKDVYSGITMPISSSYTTKHYTQSTSAEKKNTNALVFGDFSYDVKGAYTLLKQLVVKLPADKKATFEKGTSKRDALVEEQYKKERIAWAKIQAEEAKKREKLATINFWNKKDIMGTIYDEGNAANGCMPSTYKYTERSSKNKTITFCVGSVVRLSSTGQSFTVTKAMDGKSIDF